MEEKVMHVSPNSKNKWDVLISCASRASRVFNTKEEAIQYALVRARKMKTRIYIHGSDGGITRMIVHPETTEK